MQVNKIEINADHDARLDRCLEESIDILHDNIPTDTVTVGAILAIRHEITEIEAAELLQRALAVRQQQ
jgi:hypothetical protein